MINSNDIDVILALFPEVVSNEQEKVQKKLNIMKQQMDLNDSFQSKMLELRKEFEDLIKD